MRGPIVRRVDVRMGAMIGLLGLTTACGGHQGTIKNSKTFWVSNQAYEEPARLVFQSPVVWQEQPLGPQAGDVSPKVILDAKYHLHSVTPDGRLWVLGDSATNLYVWRGLSDEPPVEIQALRGRASSVLLTPDGKALVVARHADYARPQSQWQYDEDDALYIIDVETLAVKMIPKMMKRWVTQMRWGDVDKSTQQPTALFLRLAQTKHHPEEMQRVEWATKVRTIVKAGNPLDETFSIGRPRGIEGCTTVGTLNADDNGIFLNRSVDDKVESKQLVVLEGRRRGFHDYQPTFGELNVGPSCRVGYFVFGRAIYSVALTAPQQVAELATGADFLFLQAASGAAVVP